MFGIPGIVGISPVPGIVGISTVPGIWISEPTKQVKICDGLFILSIKHFLIFCKMSESRNNLTYFSFLDSDKICLG